MHPTKLIVGCALLLFSVGVVAYAYGVASLFSAGRPAKLTVFTSCHSMPVESIRYSFHHDSRNEISISFRDDASGCEAIENLGGAYAEVSTSFPIFIGKGDPNFERLHLSRADDAFTVRFPDDHLAGVHLNLIHDESLRVSGLGEKRYAVEIEAINTGSKSGPRPIDVIFWLWSVPESDRVEFRPPPTTLLSYEGERGGYRFTLDHEIIEGLRDRFVLITTNEGLVRLRELILFLMGALAGQAVALIAGSVRSAPPSRSAT